MIISFEEMSKHISLKDMKCYTQNLARHFVYRGSGVRDLNVCLLFPLFSYMFRCNYKLFFCNFNSESILTFLNVILAHVSHTAAA